MLLPFRAAQFRRDVKRVEKRGKDMAKLRTLVSLLLEGVELPQQYRDHSLKGDYTGMRDAHIEPDWLLIYFVEGEKLYLIRTGTHADLF